MRFPATAKIVAFLRARNRLIRENNLSINEWVDGYLDRCITSGEPVTVLTQWCISKDLEERLRRQGGKLVPTRKERLLFEKAIPNLASVFATNGVTLNWWMTFNRSYLDSGRIAPELEGGYKAVITALASPLVAQGWLALADWEEDLLGRRPSPNLAVFRSLDRFVATAALEREVERHAHWVREDAGLVQPENELQQDVYFQIACEAEEGRLLGGPNSPFGEFILVPLEVPERYDFFTLLVPDFKKRIAAVLPPYPWRLKDTA